MDFHEFIFDRENFTNKLVKKLCQYLIPFRSYEILKTFHLGKAQGRLATFVMSR